jgi:RimJ/RimL family protein N-acetyltransferase
MSARYLIEWPRPDVALSAFEPTEAEVEEHASELAAAYNDAHNRAMMTNTAEMSRTDVITHYSQLATIGGRPFLLHRGDTLVGDADFRRIRGGSAEFTIMVAARSAQGKGLGTKFGVMTHAFAFDVLVLTRVYVTILPQNTASRRLFEKLGYSVDNSPEARSFTDVATDVCMSVGRDEFQRAHAAKLREIRLSERS